MASKLFRRIAIVASTIAALVILLTAVAHTPFVRSRVLTWALSTVARDYGLHVDARSLRYNLATRSIALDGVSVAAAAGEPALLRADVVRVVLKRGLFLGTVAVDHLEVIRPQLTLVRHKDGTMNLPASRAEPESPTSPLRLGVVSLRQLAVTVDDEMTGRQATLGPIDLTVDTTREGTAPGTIRPTPFAVRLGAPGSDAPALTGTLSGRAGFDGSRVTMRPLQVDMPEGRLAIDGWLDVMTEKPRMDASGQVDLDLARARRFVADAGESLGGTLAARFSAAGPLLDPRVEIDLQGDRLTYRSLDQIRVHGAASLAGGRLVLKSLDARSPAGEVNLHGEIALSESATPAPERPGGTRLTAQWRAIDLDRTLESAGMALPVRAASKTDGRIEVRTTSNGLDLSQADWLSTVSADGRARLTATEPAGVNGDIGLALREQRWSLTHALTSADGNASLNGTVSGRLATVPHEAALSGRTRLGIGNLGAALARVEGAGVSVPARLANASGSLNADVTLGGTLSAPTAHGAIAVRALQTIDLPATDLDADLAADARALRISSFDARVGSARLLGSGQYAWSGVIGARLTGEASDLGRLASAFQLTTVTVAGSLTFAGTVGGTQRSPTADATVTMRDVAIDGTPVGPLDIALNVAGTRLVADARAPDLRLRAGVNLMVADPFAYEAEAVLDRSTVQALIPASIRDRMRITDGVVSATLRSRGALSCLIESGVEADLRELEVQIADARVVLDAPATLALTPGRVSATPTVIRIGQGTRARLSGTVARQPTNEPLELGIEGPVSDLVALAQPYLAPGTLAADGTFGVQLRVAGDLHTPEPSGTVAVRGATIRYGSQPPATDVTLDARIEPARLVLQSLGALWQKATVRGEGVVPWRLIAPSPGAAGSDADLTSIGAGWLAMLANDTQRATLVTRITGVTPAVLSPWLPASSLQQIEGTLDATITADSDALALDRATVSAVVDQATLSIAGVPFKQAVPTRLQLERGRASIAAFRWESQGNEIHASGGADLTTASPTLDLGVKAVVDLRILGAFATGVASGGLARTDVRVTGPLDAPVVAGQMSISDGELRIETPALVASDLTGEVRITDGRAATVALAGLVNGGTAKLTGQVDLTTPSDPRGQIAVTARNVGLAYPEGLATESNADVTLTLGAARPVLAGRITVLYGTYREPIVVTGGLLAGLRRSSVTTTAPSQSFLSRLSLDVKVETDEGIRIDNNYGRLDLTARLQVTGSRDQPGVVGRIEAAPDGEIYLAGNVYRIQRLVIDLTNPRAIEPAVSFLAETRVGNVPIEIELACDDTGPCEQEVRSQVAGVTNEEAEGMLFGLSGDAGDTGAQLARLLSGEIFGVVGRSIGLDTLRLEQGTSAASDILDDPSLLAGDVDPASRLTLGKRLGERVEVAYSQDLANSGFTWSTTYSAPFNTTFRALLLDDQNRSYEFRHEPFGAAARTPRRSRVRPRVAAVRITGQPGFPERELRGRLKVTEGDRFDFARWQEDRDRLSELYQSRGFLEARIRARRVPAGGEGAAADEAPIDLEYSIEQGALTKLDIRGIELPDELEARIRARWSNAVFDGFLERDARALVRDHLYREGQLAAVVNATVTRDDSANLKTLVIDVTPGPFVPRRLEFVGNAAVPTTRLYAAASAVGPLAAWLEPAAFAQILRSVYQEEGLLAAEIEVPPPELRAGTSVVRVGICEGELTRVRRVSLEGASALAGSENAVAAGLVSGAAYRVQLVRESVIALEQQFRQAGFLDAQVEAATSVDPLASEVDITIRVQPGARAVLADVVVEGADERKPLVARAIALEPGSPIDPSALVRTRRQLYDTGAYRSVDIAIEPQNAGPAGEVPPGSDRAVVALVRVEERPRYRFRYGLALNDDVVGPDEREQHLGLAADLENRDLFGLGTSAGVAARLRRDQQVGRVFLGANRFFGLPLRSTVFVQRQRQELGNNEFATAISDETEISTEQTYRVRRHAEVRYGYGIGRNRTFIEGDEFDIRVRVARLRTTALIDRRQNPFDPGGGWLSSATLELSRPGLGSDLSFLRGFVQATQFAKIRDGLVLASGVRVGLARTFDDQVLIPSERFYAGGATSVRGYRDDDLGARSVLGDAEGGEAMLILNGELRFPVRGWLRGVAFADAGNVYPFTGDLSLADLMVGLGAGVRVDSPIGLLRFDLALPVNRRDIDPKWRIHFGLGHAF